MPVRCAAAALGDCLTAPEDCHRSAVFSVASAGAGTDPAERHRYSRPSAFARDPAGTAGRHPHGRPRTTAGASTGLAERRRVPALASDPVPTDCRVPASAVSASVPALASDPASASSVGVTAPAPSRIPAPTDFIGPEPAGAPAPACLRAPAPALITGVLAPAAHSAGVQAPTGSIVLHLRQQRTRYGSRW
ncbi:skin secretory protein xP2-like [Amphibalanus amphitrite]|uniref:skin secretory protein xP2-like n=1 Tax=Amphibalanus amphitrite TaxID=1232801 RepID=UPI001C8FADC2|nr:skin secretory protein xP2-like [Amphibalanus amphitrite]